MATSRFGSDLVQLLPASFKVPAKLAADADFGLNTLVGIQDDGFVGDIDPSSDNYVGALVCVREMSDDTGTNGGTQAKKGLVTNAVIKMEGSGFDDTDLFAIVFASDEKTVTTTEGTDGKPQVGRIVEVIDANTVYVHVDPALAAAGATA